MFNNDELLPRLNSSALMSGAVVGMSANTSFNDPSQLANKLYIFDDRIEKLVGTVNGSDKDSVSRMFPYNGYYLNEKDNTVGQFVGDYFETPEAVRISARERLNELAAAKGKTVEEIEQTDEGRKIVEWANNRIQYIQTKINELKTGATYIAPYSMIHPYALIKLAGATGKDGINKLIDNANQRKWYEIDGKVGGYSKNPTTTAIINWGTKDERGRFPYSYTDFVFCKYWNKIQNNRMITLRRYPNPVTDSVEPGNYQENSDPLSKEASPAEISKAPFAPLCTAVTYFGEGTENVLSDILAFTVGYEWEEKESDIWKTTSSQPDEGAVTNGNDSYVSGPLASFVKMTGILGDLSGKNKIIPTDAVGLPPDPYHEGPYENRILGPINVINKVYKRKRGLTFSQDGLTITFSYVSRPISHVNNKAIMLDLLANIMLMTSSSGTFFGGLHRYRCEHPAVYPWRSTGTLNKLYKGKLFGKEGAISSVLSEAFSADNFTFAMGFAKELLNDVVSAAGNLLNKILGKDTEEKEVSKGEATEKVKGTVGRAIAAKYLKGATIPWLEGAKALLTGDPIGDWHLTIGNPLNPIAMIGNLIVESSDITFSDELGPDDFPIGFTAKIKLKHGMGRDKDAVESMFNRGYGRIYSLPDHFKSSADGETKIDEWTGNTNGRTNIEEWSAIAPAGRDYISKIANPSLSNHGTLFNGLNQYDLDLSSLGQNTKLTDVSKGLYISSPWATHYIL